MYYIKFIDILCCSNECLTPSRWFSGLQPIITLSEENFDQQQSRPGQIEKSARKFVEESIRSSSAPCQDITGRRSTDSVKEFGFLIDHRLSLKTTLNWPALIHQSFVPAEENGYLVTESFVIIQPTMRCPIDTRHGIFSVVTQRVRRFFCFRREL